MTRTGTCAAILAFAGTVLIGQQPAVRTSDRVRLESAINKEMIDGDLPSAVEIYRALVQSADRGVRAQATLRLGRAYSRLGHADAVTTLERAATFTDQPEVVAAASAALGRTTQSRPATPPKTVLVNSREANIEYVAVSADGRYLAFSDYNAGANLVVRDNTTGLSRQITTDAVAPGTEIAEKTFSRDGKRIAFTFDVEQIRVIDVDLAAAEPPGARTVFTAEKAEVAPYEWSADGSRLAVQVSRGRDSAQIGVLTIATGAFQAVRSIDWRGSSRLSLSPDGAYLAYDRPTGADSERDVYVVSTDGKQEVAVAAGQDRDAVVGWSVDGRHLLFVSERNGTTNLYARPMRSGRPSGSAALLRSGVSQTAVGITRQGDVYFEVNPSTIGIYVAPFDATGRFGALSSKPIAGTRPAWSPDGKQIAHAVARSRAVLAVTDVGSARTREFVLSDLNYVQEFAWGPDGRSVVAKGASAQGRAGLFRIDARTGDVTTIALVEPEPAGPVNWAAPVWWRGVESIAHLRIRTNQPGRLPGIRQPGADAPKLLERELGTGTVRELVDFSAEPWATHGITASPDRRLVASRSPGPGETAAMAAYRGDPTSVVVLHEVGASKSRRVWTAPFAQAFTGPVEWLPDGTAVLVTRRTEAGGARFETWIVPIDGSTPRKVAGGPQNLIGDVNLSPDGRRVAMLAGDRRNPEIRVFERVVPGAR
jgi:Tol biopolymer transport system component